MPVIQTGASDPPVVPRETALHQSSVHPWVPQCGSRHPVEAGAEAWGVETSPRGGEAPMGELRRSPSGSVCVLRDDSLSTVVLYDKPSTSRAGCYGAAVAEATAVHISPNCAAPGSSGESLPRRGPSVISSPVLAGPSMVLGPDVLARRLSDGDSDQEGPFLSGEQVDPSPPPGVMEAVGLASEGAQLISSGLSTEVVETIHQSRALSTRKLPEVEIFHFMVLGFDAVNKLESFLSPVSQMGVRGCLYFCIISVEKLVLDVELIKQREMERCLTLILLTTVVKLITADGVNVRLVGGHSRCAGRVEVHHRGQWGTVCGDLWDLADAAVVCRELDCGEPVDALGDAHFGPGSGSVWMSFVMCNGSESTLKNCGSGGWGRSNCDHTEDAGVICSEVRLVGGSRCSGRLEILDNQTWVSVCAAAFDQQDAEVVCRELDCGAPVQVLGEDVFGKGDAQMWTQEIQCRGNESQIHLCPTSPSHENHCLHEHNISLLCTGNS
ncbi:scavenger receptor cysteine-rich domain-containing group B protein-like [Megalobrama amblycephala]|uniref:scavenger receptor cysteine-rich domain-containing group B protein-like n=1 Tax=Megalobrama amblycephala TaxID=75352 RepID=UPI002013F82D|nr:scavenger receptor cysteine-rich domain-containing group B protein-like [Megalobrama amblycephala]